jgi:rhodanese-related sulfurtransferase
MRLKRFGLALLVLGVLTTVILASGCAAPAVVSPPAETQIIKDITPLEAHALIQENIDNNDFIILDVRTLEEYDASHIDDSILIDYYSDDFGDEVSKLDRNKTYLVYCRSGNRSSGARDLMKELGFKEVYNMVGGIVKWEADGLPVVE